MGTATSSAWKSWCGRLLMVAWLSAGSGCGNPADISGEQELVSVQQAAATVYEAESATLSGGAVVATDHTGYSGTGFVGGFIDSNKGNAAAQFTITASAAGTYDVVLRYANGTGSAQTLSLYVDGTKVGQISLAATTNWDSWATRTDTRSLTAGTHTLRYKFDTTDSGNVNLDNISVSAQTTPPPSGSGPLYEAESAALSGGAVVATDHTGYSGTGFVGGFTDSNKGNAAAQFTITASAAGTYDVALRYANGTGVAQTLSLYVDGTKVGQISLAATTNWDSWATRTDTRSLTAGTHTLRYKFDTTDSGNVNLDSITLSDPIVPPPAPPPPPAGSGFVYEAEDQFLSGGVAKESAYLRNFSAPGARVIFTVNMASATSTTVGLRYLNASASNKTLNVYVNGLYALTTTLPSTGSTTWSGKTETLSLRRGLNTLSYQYDSGNTGGVLVDALTVVNGQALTARGATLPYQELEAEAGTTNAQVLTANRSPGTIEAESSGRRAVKLTQTGHYVQWTAPQTANSLVIRYSMPDAAAGGGINATLSLYVNGTKTQTLSLTSRYAWVYGGYPYGDSPSYPHKPNEWDPGAHRFYDESRFLLSSIPAGATVKLQKDSGDTAASYTIDLINLEQVDAAPAMPANFVSITDFGAIANDTGDDVQALRNAITSAKSSGKGVWIPSGTFRLSDRVNVDNIQVRGAGPWYTVLQGVGGKGGFYGTGSNVKVLDLAFFNDSVQRNDSADHAVFEGNFGTGSLIQNLWIEHAKVGFWLSPGTDGLYVVDGRIRDTFADGVNIYGGVKNTTISHFNARNTGDDAFAMWSDGSPNDNCTFRYDTAQNPNLANTFAVYNGKDNKVLDSVASDTLYGASAGVFLSNWFSALPFTGTTEVRRMTLNRTSGVSPPVDWDMPTGALFILATTQSITGQIVVDGVEINDSTYSGIKLAFGKGPSSSPPANNTYSISPVSISNVTITGAGSYGLEFYNVLGTGNFSSVTVTGASLGGLSNPNNKYTLVRGSGNSGW
ncbi:CBM35 domain-containing protein [Hyalangium versicolor]|uniref:CBM35 domain-containing protein n=1 Tax=Hyalangium versicolor TaxID=2861190 RepID=UPI001CD031EB|nr:CBM35 domain-containing protein [Hyalangium versicolor]